MLNKLLEWDKQLFFKINGQWTNAFLDHNFPWWRESITWYPLYLFLFVFGIMNLGRKVWFWILAFVLNVVLTDQISSTYIKPYFNRLRPCQDAALTGHVRMLLNHCSGGHSFPSSHATNHFGAAVFLHCTLHKFLGNWSYIFFLWAFTVSYGQVYVGVHYPLDIVGGTILGSTIGYIIAYVLNRTTGLQALTAA